MTTDEAESTLKGATLSRQERKAVSVMCARVAELEKLARRALCYPIGASLESDIINALNLQPKG